MSEYTVLGIGEILWDLLPDGKKLGGAVTNLIHFVNLLGCKGSLVSGAGQDDPGDEIIARIEEIGLSTRFLQRDADHATGTVDIELDENGKPSYIIHENTAWDNVVCTSELKEAAASADAICFGSLFQREKVSRKTLRALVETASENAVILCDINLRQHFFNEEIIRWSLENATVLKLNDEEVKVAGELLGIKGDERNVVEEIISQFSLDLVALTRGGNGSTLYTADRVSEHPGVAAEVKDTVGAGDSFSGVVTVGLLKGEDLDVINERANRIAAYVCSQSGATPEVPQEILK